MRMARVGIHYVSRSKGQRPEGQADQGSSGLSSQRGKGRDTGRRFQGAKKFLGGDEAREESPLK